MAEAQARAMGLPGNEKWVGMDGDVFRAWVVCTWDKSLDVQTQAILLNGTEAGLCILDKYLANFFLHETHDPRGRAEARETAPGWGGRGMFCWHIMYVCDFDGGHECGHHVRRNNRRSSGFYHENRPSRVDSQSVTNVSAWGPSACSNLTVLELALAALAGLIFVSPRAPSACPAVNYCKKHISNKEQQPQTFVPLSREREVSRTRARRALAGGWAVPRMIMSLSASPDAAGLPAEGGLYRTRSRGGEIIVAAAAGFSHTAFITDEGKLCLFGEGAAVAGGDLARLEATAGEGGGGGGVGLGLREGGGLVRRSEQQEGPDPLTVRRTHTTRTSWRADTRGGTCLLIYLP